MKAGPTPARERLLVGVFAAVQFTMLLDFMVLMPLGPELMEAFGLGPAEYGTTVSVYTAASAASGLSGVFWLHLQGTRRLLFAFYLAFILATVGCALAPSIGWFVAFRCLTGAASGLLWSVVLATIFSLVPPGRRGSAMGVVMSAYATSAVAGVPIAMILAENRGFRAAFLLIAALSAVLLLGLVVLVPRESTSGEEGDARVSERRREEVWPFWREPRALGGWLLTFLLVLAGFLLIPYLSVFFVKNLAFPEGRLSVLYFCGGGMTFISSRLIGFWVDRVSAVRALVFLVLGASGVHLVLTHLETQDPLLTTAVFVLFMTLTSGRSIPAIALISEVVDERHRSRFLSVNTAVSDLASGVGASVSGALLGSGAAGRLEGFGRVGWVSAIASLLALTVALALFRRLGREAGGEA